MSKDAKDDWLRVISFTVREVTFLLADLTRLDDDLSATTRALKARLKKELPRPAPQSPEDIVSSGSRTTSLRDVPPEPGTVPVPSGHVRLYSIVGAIGESAPAEVIRREGLRLDKATPYRDQFSEFTAIWAAIGYPDKRFLHYHTCIVEFSAPAEEVEHSAGSLRPGVTVTLSRDITPSELLAVYEPWHGIFWLLRDEPRWNQRSFWEDPANEWEWKKTPSETEFPDADWQKAVRAMHEATGAPRRHQ